MADHVNDNTKADALERALRTLWTGFGVDALVAIGAVLVTWLGDADITSPEAWAGVAVLVGKSVLHSVASYLVRLKVTPTQQ